MNITDKQAVEAAGVLREYCRNFGDRCGNECPCVFNYRGKVCNVETGATPDKWHIPTLPAEPEPAEPDKPYLCKLFGVGVGDRFDVLLEDGAVWLKNVWVAENGVPHIVSAENEDCSSMIMTPTFADLLKIAVKHPDRIRRKSRVVLSEDDKAIVRRCIADGLEWLTSDSGDSEIWLHKGKPALGESGWYDSEHAVYSCPDFIFPWAEAGVLYYLPDLMEAD